MSSHRQVSWVSLPFNLHVVASPTSFSFMIIAPFASHKMWDVVGASRRVTD